MEQHERKEVCMQNDNSQLLREDVLSYRDSGYLILKDVFTSGECDDIVATYEKYAMPDFRAVMNLQRGYVEYPEAEQGNLLERIAVTPEDSEKIYAVIRNSKIVSALEALQGGEVAALQTMFLFKRAASPYASQAWNPHQDNAYPRSPYGAYVNSSIACTDEDRENGCIFVYPRSHRESLLEAERVPSLHEKPGTNPGYNIKRIPSEYRREDIFLKQGSALIMHGNLIHGSYPNSSLDRSRPVLHIPYITKGCPFFPGLDRKRREISTRKVLS